MIDNNITASQSLVRPAPVRADAVASAGSASVSLPAVVAAPPEPVQPMQPARAVAELPSGNDLANQLEDLTQQLNEFVQANARELEFRVNDDGGRVVILVRQSETGEVLRTIPPDEARTLASNLNEGAAVLFSQLA